MISPESQGGPDIALITIACGWTFIGIALLGVSLLIWARRMKNIGLGLDDYLTLLALVTTIALVAQTTWAIVCEGQDHHEAEISKAKFALVVRSLLINQTLWGVINTLVRLSATLLIKKVFGVRGWMVWTTWLLLVIAIIYGLVVFLETFLICRPMAVDWNARINGTCGDQVVSYLVLEVLGLSLDLAILVVPLPLIWRLSMSLRRKMEISILFSIGFLVFIVTGLRIQALHMVNADDFTYSKGYLGLLSALGASLGIIVCCAPAVPILNQHYRHASPNGEKTRVNVDEENTETHDEAQNERPLPMTEYSATKTRGRSARWSVDGCDAPPRYMGLRRNHTF